MVGRAGAGKTTVARALSAAFDLPLVHLDQLAWDPGWRPVDRTVFDARHAEAVAAERWVLDGGYLSRAGWSDRLARADVVVLVDAPLAVSLWRIMRRGVRRPRVSRADLPEGCRDGLSPSFLYWTVTWGRRTAGALDVLLGGGPGLPPLVVLRHGDDPTAAVEAAHPRTS